MGRNQGTFSAGRADRGTRARGAGEVCARTFKPLLVGLLAVACAAPGTYRLETEHFVATYPRGWTLQRQTEHGIESHLFSRAEDRVEVRLYGWLVRHELGDPNAEALGRLWGDPDLALPRHRSPTQHPLACPEIRRAGRMFSRAAPFMDLTDPGGWRSFLLAAHAEGSLVAVVARTRDQAITSCAAVEQMIATVQAFLDGVQPSNAVYGTPKLPASRSEPPIAREPPPAVSAP